jgi:hypothetical protein
MDTLTLIGFAFGAIPMAFWGLYSLWEYIFPTPKPRRRR